MLKAYVKFVIAVVTLIFLFLLHNLALEHADWYGLIVRVPVFAFMVYYFIAAVINGAHFFGGLCGYEIKAVKQK